MFLLLACSDYAVNPKREDVDGEARDDCADAPPGSYAVPLDDTCAFEPPEGAFAPVVEWRWAGSLSFPGYEDVMMTPGGSGERRGCPLAQLGNT